MTRPRKRGSSHKGWKDSARNIRKITMTDTVINSITLPMTDVNAMALAKVLKQIPPDGALVGKTETAPEPATMEYTTEPVVL